MASAGRELIMGLGRSSQRDPWDTVTGQGAKPHEADSFAAFVRVMKAQDIAVNTHRPGTTTASKQVWARW